MLWNEILSTKYEIYTRVLDSFENEMRRLVDNNPDVLDLLLKYLIGKNDFYKIMKFRKRTIIQGFNLNGTLNQASNQIQPLHIISRLTTDNNRHDQA